MVENPHADQNLLDDSGVPFVLYVKDGFGMEVHLLRENPVHTAAVKHSKKDSTSHVVPGLFEVVRFPPYD